MSESASLKPMKTDSGRVISLPADALTSWMMTRDNGAAVRQQLTLLARNASSDDTVVIDLSAVEAMTYSFADEFLGKFLAERDESSEGPGIVLEGVGEDPLETTLLVLERRSLAVVLREVAGPRLLTRDGHLVATYERALMLQEFRASDMAEQLGITPQNVNNRLKKLTAIGALRRKKNSAERGGKEFAYRVVD
jgi:hypothetical protein